MTMDFYKSQIMNNSFPFTVLAEKLICSMPYNWTSCSGNTNFK